uniref:Neural proliferation, differentiation and control, 1a n=1 Tax=Stegastes partitus TaxID=144197 RepID=A0A3B5ASG8_9TELE
MRERIFYYFLQSQNFTSLLADVLRSHSRCPSPIECAQQRRRFCQPGSSYCGPCMSPLQENEEGRCVLMRHRQHGKMTSYTDLDEEIDFLHSVIAKQEVSQMKTPKKQSKHPGKTPAQTTTAAPRPSLTTTPNTPTPQPRVTGAGGRGGPIAVPTPKNDNIIVSEYEFLPSARTSSCNGYLCDPQSENHCIPDGGKCRFLMGDKTLAQSAQMYHYQHQKQQMLSMGNHKPEPKGHENEVTSDEEEVGGDFTVYECPGLAPTGEMEVKNPLFDDSTINYQGNQK